MGLGCDSGAASVVGSVQPTGVAVERFAELWRVLEKH
jgi:hypothetical protein